MGQSWGATGHCCNSQGRASKTPAGSIKRARACANRRANHQLGAPVQASSNRPTGAGGLIPHRPCGRGPVTSLLFDVGQAAKIERRVCWLSGTHDWGRSLRARKPSLRWQREGPQIGAAATSSVAGQRRTHFQPARHMAQGGPWEACCWPGRTPPSRQGRSGAGPTQRFALPPDGWGTTTYPL